MEHLHDYDWAAARGDMDRSTNPAPAPATVSQLLSAASYKQPKVTVTAAAGKPQLYGGVILAEEDHNNVTPSRTRRKARTSKDDARDNQDNSDDAGRKQRGRPRVDNRDENAVDRRRTQIRLAQRAYRDRKETTIATLQQKVTDMETRFARMETIFTTLQDSLVGVPELGASNHISQQLRLLRSEFDQTDGIDAGRKRSNSKMNVQQSSLDSYESNSQQISPNTVGSDSNYAVVPSTRPSHANSVVNGLTGLSSDILQQNSHLTRHTQPWSGVSVFDGGQIGTIMQNMPAVTQLMGQNLDIERAYPLKTQYTYSFQESTFARRLQRYCIETAFQNLTNPHTDQQWIARTFHFALSSFNRLQVRMKFKELLSRGAGEPLEEFEVPFYHIGGAGFHFPRRDGAGKPIFEPNLHSPLTAAGPWGLVNRPDQISDEEAQRLLGSIGYDGEWFNSREVEEYLKLRGIYLDGGSSLIDIDASRIEAISPPALSVTMSDSSMSTIATSPSAVSSGHEYSNANLVGSVVDASFGNHHPQQMLFEKTAGLDQDRMYGWTAPTTTVGVNQAMAEHFSAYDAISRKNRVVSLDIGKFMDRVIYGGACLGRAPGFRREAVDSALLTALQEAF